MSQSGQIFRSNSQSAFYSAVKSRASANQSNSCKILYQSEVNNCPSCRSKIITSSSNSAQPSSKVVFEVPNFGYLASAFLKTTWTQGNITTTHATNANLLVENAGAWCFERIRLVSDGVIVAELTPEYIVAKLYKESDNAKRRMLQELLAGFKAQTAAGSHSIITANNGSLFPEVRAASGVQTTYCPLIFFFDALTQSQNRALPLGVLNRVFIEVDTNEKAYWNGKSSAVGNGTGIDISSMELVSMLTELSEQEAKMAKQISFEAGGTPLSLLGYNVVQHIEPGISYTAGTDKLVSIKMNMFAGTFSKFYIYAINSADEASADKKNHNNYVAIKSISLKANGVELYKMDTLDKNENILEDYLNGSYEFVGDFNGDGAGADQRSVSWSAHKRPVRALAEADFDAVVAADSFSKAEQVAVGDDIMKAVNDVTRNISTSSINPQNVYCLDFKTIGSDKKNTSMTGSLDFGNLGVPILDVTLSGLAYAGANVGATNTTTGYKVVVMGEQHNLVSYATNNAGRTGIRSIS